MRRSLDRLWRLVATGASLLVFGACGTVFSLLLFPLLMLWPNRVARQRLVALLIHKFFRDLVTVLRVLGVMRVEWEGTESLRDGQPAIVVANHPCYLDVMVLLAATPRACCVVKSAHWRNPVFSGIVRAAGYVSNADPVQLVDDCVKQLQAGYKLLIFPEGTRSPASNQLHRFSRGFAYVALDGAAPLVPVLMHCDPPAFTKTVRWYQVPAQAFCIRVRVLDPFDFTNTIYGQSPRPVQARELTDKFEQHITRGLFEYGFFKAGT